MKASPHNQVAGDILIVDDDLNNLQMLSDILVARGYEVRGAKNGTVALDFIQNDPPDLVLLDVRMPGMDGYEVCKRLKAEQRYADLPIIFLSALQETEDRVRGFEAGAVDFISKPFQADEVSARVRTHLTLKQLRINLENEVEQRTADLKESETRYRTMIEASPVSIMVVRNGCFITDTARLGTDDILFCPLDVLAPNEGVVENANEYLFFDDVHPTTTFHKAVADRAFEKIDGRSAEIECDGFNNKEWKKSKRKNHLKW